jgi:hypothetical protein
MTTPLIEDIFEEAIPDLPPRIGGKGREPIKWEAHLAPLEDRLLNAPHRLWSYPTHTAALSRMATVRTRLTNAAPDKNWELKVRAVPNTDPQLFGVYVVFYGQYTPEQMKTNAQARQKRRDALVKARQSKAEATQPGDNGDEAPASPEAVSPPQTAKEKLAAKAASK